MKRSSSITSTEKAKRQKCVVCNKVASNLQNGVCLECVKAFLDDEEAPVICKMCNSNYLKHNEEICNQCQKIIENEFIQDTNNICRMSF